MLSSGMKCYHLEWNVIICDGMLSAGMKCYHLGLSLSSGTKYHLGWKCYHLELMVSSGPNVIIWDETSSSGANVIIWDYMLSSGMNCYHLGCNVIIWDKMLSSGANIIMVSSGGYVIIWCYHVMLSSRMITHPFFIFPENFTHSLKCLLTFLSPKTLGYRAFRTIKIRFIQKTGNIYHTCDF